MVVVFLLLDIVLNSIIGLTPYVDNFTRKCTATGWSGEIEMFHVFIPLVVLYLNVQIWVEWHLGC